MRKITSIDLQAQKWIVQEWANPAHCADIVQAVAAVCIYAVKTPSRPTRKGVVSA